MQALILGSTSPFRRTLLKRLRLPFTVAAPEIDERPKTGESAESLARRLAEAKARDVGRQHTAALIVGSDQVASVSGRILGKPGDRARAIEQLSDASGKTVSFHTGICLFNSQTGRIQSAVECFAVRFRNLRRDQIERYVDMDQPIGCAGAFKVEDYGITLCSALEGRDPNSLVGLPLIRLVEMLAAEGIELP